MKATTRTILVESAVAHRMKVVSENIGLELELRAAAELLGIPLGTFSAWKSTKEATINRRDGRLLLHFDSVLLDRVSTYRRPLRTDVDIRHGARSKGKQSTALPETFTLFGEEEICGDGAIVPADIGKIVEPLKKISEESVAFSTALTLLRERASALSSELERTRDEIRRLEEVTV